jgi:hypothetical protein
MLHFFTLIFLFYFTNIFSSDFYEIAKRLGFPILLESGKEIFLNKKGPGKKSCKNKAK